MKINKLLVALFIVVTSLISAESAFAQKDTLKPREQLGRAESLTSKNGRYMLKLQEDGNLVLYRLKKDKTVHSALWSSGTNGQSAEKAVMQIDGNFVIYNYNKKAIWNSGTSDVENIDAFLVLQNDGNLVMYNKNSPRRPWNTKTAGK